MRSGFGFVVGLLAMDVDVSVVGRRDGNIRRTVLARRNCTTMWRLVVKSGKWKLRLSDENIHLLYYCDY